MLIGQNKKISLDRFIYKSLYDKDNGYYIKKNPFGKKGDFNLAISKVYQRLSKVDKNWKSKKIKARFICALTVYGLKKNPIQSLGIPRD